MPCAIGCIALFFARVILVLVYIFGNGWLQASFQTMLFPILGFIFLPLTTLAYAWAWHAGDGTISGLGIAIIVLGVLVDLGMLGGGGTSARSSAGARGSA